MSADDRHGSSERTPLLNQQNGQQQQHTSEDGGDHDDREVVKFDDNDDANPRNWPRRRKMLNVLVIALMAVLSPLASSAFVPGIKQIADDLSTTPTSVIGTTTGFMIGLGLGPLLVAPLSETFGRRTLYLSCFSVFALLQIPTALAPNIAALIAVRTLSGFFGSVGIANGGGTISDMFAPEERAGVFGWYLLGPLLGPTLGPMFGGVTVTRLGWRWVFWILTILCVSVTLASYFFLHESYAPIILQRRKEKMEREQGKSGRYRAEGLDESPLSKKLLQSMSRPIKIFVQPIVLTMSLYQALIFATTYSIYTNFQEIYEGRYGFNTEQVGLLYLGPGLGFLVAVWFLVPRIDTTFKSLTEKNDGESKPEFRLPIANIGAVLIPISLFWFGWAVELKVHWAVSIVATFFYGLGQVTIFNTAQNYYIDSFEKYAASAIAAGAVFRSMVGGIVPLACPALFDKVGYGWGISVFGFIAVALAPAPVLFYAFGQRIRERFAVDLG